MFHTEATQLPMPHKLFYLLVVIITMVLPTWAQDAKPANRPTEYGIRFTPEMARFISREIAKGPFVHRYQLEQDKIDDAAELISRRIMQAAHASGADGQELAEFLVAQFLKIANEHQGGLRGIPRELGMGFGQRILPLMPIVRDFMRNISQDIRPMLPMKQQLKFGADLMGMNTALDAFEKNMELWAKGEVDPNANPFKSSDQPITKNEKGESKRLELVRKASQVKIEKGRKSEWEKYVEQAKQFYNFDDAQAAAADSLLRETIERAETIYHDPIRRERLERNYTWISMLRYYRNSRNYPLQQLVNRANKIELEPIDALEEELKNKIDQIPTQDQRAEAEKRIDAALAEQGFEVDDEHNE